MIGSSRAFVTDRTLQLAVFHLFGIVGEAATRVSSDLRRSHPEIDWRGIIGLRNYLMHAYDRVDLPTVWRPAREDVPHRTKRDGYSSTNGFIAPAVRTFFSTLPVALRGSGSARSSQWAGTL
ncbi:MAG: hypothetical protein DCC71_14505 [Proteobacteria bacterium]|nr:MAG: hypothetical protein DCC71_14505 [Pseudomonadota bacterium]